MDPILSESSEKIQSAHDHLQTELSSIRAGRANPALLENVLVSAYGAQMKIVELGTISAPQPSLITVTVWDPSVVKDVEKGVLEANLGLNPSTEGNVVRVPIPPLTEERRQEYIKLAHQKAEEAKVAIRQIRQESRQEWERQQKVNEFGEDELFRREKLLQEFIDKMSSKVDEMVKVKEEDLRTI